MKNLILVLLIALFGAACATDAPTESSTEHELCTVEVCDEYGCYHQLVGCQGNGSSTGLPPTTPTGPTSGPVSCVPYNCGSTGDTCTYPEATCGSNPRPFLKLEYLPAVPGPNPNRLCFPQTSNLIVTTCINDGVSDQSYWYTTSVDIWACAYFGSDPVPGVFQVPLTRWSVNGPACSGGVAPPPFYSLPDWWQTTKTTGGGGGGSTEPPCHGSRCTVEQGVPTQTQ